MNSRAAPHRAHPDADARRKSAVAQQLTGLQMSRRVEATQRSRPLLPPNGRAKYEGEDPIGNL